MEEQKENNGFADPGIWILLIILVFAIGYVVYDFYQEDGAKSKINTFIDFAIEEFTNATSNINSNSNSNIDSIANTNTNIDTITNSKSQTPDSNTNTNLNANTNTIPGFSTSTIFDWKKLELNKKLSYPKYNLEISINKIGTNAVLDIKYIERDNYHVVETNPGATGWYPNPTNYKNIGNDSLLDYATKLYRTHYKCDGTLDTSIYPEGKEIIDLTSGYSNYLCRSREQEQCYTDGSFDNYYDENCDFENVVFAEGDVKCLDNLAISVISITTQTGINVGVTEKTSDQSCNSFKLF